MFGRIRLSIPKTTLAYVAILGVLVVGAVMREINLLIILAGMMCGPLLISWQMIRTNLKQLTVRRQLPRGVYWDAPFNVEFVVKNPRKRIDSWAIVLEDRVRNLTRNTQSFETGMCFLPHVSAGQTQTVGFPCRLSERGRYRFGPLRISTRVPVGLLQGRATSKRSDELLVFPRLGFLLKGWHDLVRFDQQGQRRTHHRQGQVEGDYFGLRDWRAGDCRRWIHWRSSAKRDELVVREFEEHRNQDLIVLLDLADLSDASIHDSDNGETTANANTDSSSLDVATELAISFVATAVAEHCQKGAGYLTVRLVGNKAHEVRGPAGPALLNDALELLSEIMPSEDPQSPFEALGSLPNVSRDDHIVIVRPGHIDLERWCNKLSDEHDRDLAKVSNAALIDTSQAGFFRLFSWEDPGTSGLEHANPVADASAAATVQGQR